jgi:hypothetical protein
MPDGRDRFQRKLSKTGRANQRIPDADVLTLNRPDFIRPHRVSEGGHAGMIVCTRDDGNAPAWVQDKKVSPKGAG